MKKKPGENRYDGLVVQPQIPKKGQNCGPKSDKFLFKQNA